GEVVDRSLQAQAAIRLLLLLVVVDVRVSRVPAARRQVAPALQLQVQLDGVQLVHPEVPLQRPGFCPPLPAHAPAPDRDTRLALTLAVEERLTRAHLEDCVRRVDEAAARAENVDLRLAERAGYGVADAALHDRHRSPP